MTNGSSIRALAVPAALSLALALGACGGKKGPVTPTFGNRVPILSRVEAGTKVDPTLAEVSVVLPAAELNADWPQAGNTPGKAYGNLALGENPGRIWTASIAGSSGRERLAAAPVVGGGKLFVFDTEGLVHALDAQTGREVWRVSFAIKGDGATSVFGGGASFDNGKVYVTTGVGEVAALDAATGKQLWKAKPAGPLRGSPTIAFDAVYAMTQDNQLVALNAADGAVLWTVSASTGLSGVFGVAAPAVGAGTVVAGFSTGELVAYRYENGRTLWSDALARTSLSTTVGVLTDIDADPIIDRGRVFALGQGGRMAAYELTTGQRVWELNLAGISTPAIAGDWIFTLTDDAKLLCIARATGKARWVTQLPHFENEKKKSGQIYWTGPVLAGSRLWLGNSRGEVYSANVADGKASLFQKVGKRISLAPIVADRTIYVLDDGGQISAFR
ncbi:PQQ-binding-like beta-propeller repeat protein [Novosphingobium flavum]|uniref:PQQ-binding-like beta-propeller repeat protein n=1 Tax=Novosphingobium flavum TaxID=1778672 RepID=A0A7X1FRV4_9SPHN|nr:PQQ-binding-like beta-propeller repeat protein [Novosphingobium flavum]MBC2665825.1 PQQ-binding-like beta-propeller repeat protein [Novosphingobium flavum]